MGNCVCIGTLCFWLPCESLSRVLRGVVDENQVSQIIEALIHGPHEKTKDQQRKWLKLHTVRMILVDIPAMACFLGGLVHLI